MLIQSKINKLNSIQKKSYYTKKGAASNFVYTQLGCLSHFN